MNIRESWLKRGFSLNNNIIKRAGTALLAAALIVQPFGGTVDALMTVNYASTTFTSAELANWSTDRTTPSGGYESVSFGGRNDVLEMRINKDAQSTQGAFYHTEGLQRQVPASDSVKAEVYVDSSWTGKAVRAGLWGVGKTQAGGLSDSYPIVEYTTDGFTGWRVWDAAVGWVNLSGVAYDNDAWNLLSITHDDDEDTYTFGVNGVDVKTIAANAATAHLGAAILNSKNYGAATQSYTVHWSNFAYGDYVFTAETPTNAVFSNPAVCGGYTNQPNTVASWSPVVDATSYTYKAWKDGHPAYSSLATAYTVAGITGTSQPGAFNIGEGTYYFAVQAVYADGQKSDWSTPCAATYDKTKPVAKITVPSTDGKAVRGVVAVTGQATDANIKSHWFEITGPDNYTKYFNNMNTTNSSHSFNWDTAGLNGTFKIRYVATDRAGNRSDAPNYSEPTIRTVVVDNTAPVGDITSPADGSTVVATGGKITVNGTVTDNRLMNRVGVQLVKPGVSGHIVYLYDHMVNQNPGVWEVEIDAAALNLANGTYGLNLYFVDMLGNVSVKKSTFTLNNPDPTLNTEDFGVGSWSLGADGFRGVNVGFNIHDFKTVDEITVDLHDADGKVVTNTASAALLAMVNDGRMGPSLSTAFVTRGTLTDTWCDGASCWDFGTYGWTHTSKTPVKAVVKVVGTDIYGKAVTETKTNETFSEAAGNFQSVLPPASEIRNPNFTTNSPTVRGASTENAAAPRVTRANVNPNANVLAAADEAEVLGQNTVTPAAVFATAGDADYTASDISEETTAGAGNTGWLWWAVPGGAAAFGGVVWGLLAARRRD